MSTPKPIAVKLPSTGTLARNVCDFFRKNPLEELDGVDISLKFNTTTARVVTDLAPWITAGLLTAVSRSRKDPALKTYGAGAELERAYEALDQDKPTADATATTEAAAKPQKAPRAPKATSDKPPAWSPKQLDVHEIHGRVRSDLKLPSKAKKGSEWDPVFGALGKPGQSLPLPIEAYRAAQQACAMRRRHRPNDGWFTTRILEGGTGCAIFRLNGDGTTPKSLVEA